jgi:hypothetical protein
MRIVLIMGKLLDGILSRRGIITQVIIHNRRFEFKDFGIGARKSPTVLLIFSILSSVSVIRDMTSIHIQEKMQLNLESKKGLAICYFKA